MRDGLDKELANIFRADQTGAALADFAAMIHGYYDALRQAGFFKDDALVLAGEYQDMLIACSMERLRGDGAAG